MVKTDQAAVTAAPGDNRPAPSAAADAASGAYHLNFSPGFAAWLRRHDIGLALSTYELGKVVMLGAPPQGLAASDQGFDMAMALLGTEHGFYLSMKHQVWRFENGLMPGQLYEGCDRLYMPRQCQVTGGVDIHDLAIDRRGRLLAAVTLYNCIADLDHQGSFNPLWRPDFIDGIVGEDRCHLNGFCLKEGRLGYASLIGRSNTADGWRNHRADGGEVIEMATDRIVAGGLSMPHSPRLHAGQLWVLEGGAGWFGRIDLTAGRFERRTWIPGFLRGLRFIGDYAVIGSSRPRHRSGEAAVFTGLPLQDDLSRRGEEAVCGLHVVNLNSGLVEHQLTITGAVQEIYDLAILPQTRIPRLLSPDADEAVQLVFLGPDQSAERTL